MVEEESVRQHLLNSLLAAANDPESQLRIIVTIRADFFDRPADVSRIWGANPFQQRSRITPFTKSVTAGDY